MIQHNRRVVEIGVVALIDVEMFPLEFRVVASLEGLAPAFGCQVREEHVGLAIVRRSLIPMLAAYVPEIVVGIEACAIGCGNVCPTLLWELLCRPWGESVVGHGGHDRHLGEVGEIDCRHAAPGGAHVQVIGEEGVEVRARDLAKRPSPGIAVDSALQRCIIVALGREIVYGGEILPLAA